MKIGFGWCEGWSFLIFFQAVFKEVFKNFLRKLIAQDRKTVRINCLLNSVASLQQKRVTKKSAATITHKIFETNSIFQVK